MELENNAETQKKRIPELTDWLERLEDLIKQIRNNFETANTTLNEVKKPFPRFDQITSELGMYFSMISHISDLGCLAVKNTTTQTEYVECNGHFLFLF